MQVQKNRLHKSRTLLHFTFPFLLLSSISILSPLNTSSSAIIIAPPSSISDYRRLASLVVSTFDDYAPESKERHLSIITTKWDEIKWSLYEKAFTEEFTFRQYASTARRMRGKKYCLLIAKEDQLDSKKSMRSGDCSIVGMVEMGMSICPSFSIANELDPRVDQHKAETFQRTTGIRYNSESIPQPTIGVLCIKSTHQNQGIGRVLIQKCERIALEVWKERQIFVDVEPDNVDALAFFQKCGYQFCVDGSGTTQVMRKTTVFRRRVEEVKPHCLLRKSLGGSN